MSDIVEKDYVLIEEEMKKSYLDYSMSMITARALPDVRDGLKPVHRRVLFAMNELGMPHNRAHKKSARVVGDVIGKYHPHGDTAVYDALVRLAQDFSLRYPMIDGQGNFGSIDGDRAAAMRYTECRMTRMAEEMLQDLEKDTVDLSYNYDETLEEPTVLPAKAPFLLLNGSTGIAVGMATNMAPHNFTDISNAMNAYLDNPEITIDELIQIVPGPDFPTGGFIYGRNGIHEAYRTGRGKVKMRAKAEIEEIKDREQIIITEIPYMVNKTTLLEKMAHLVRNKNIEGVSFVRDESDRKGMRIVIGIKRDGFAEIVLNQLYKYTALQSTFGINNLALVNGRPKLLNLKELIGHFIDHRFEVIRRRTSFELRKAEARAHILEGLIIAADNIDEVIKIVRGSEDEADAQRALSERFSLSEEQAKAITAMRLGRLTKMNRLELEEEFAELQKLIADLKDILANEDRVKTLIRADFEELRGRYNDERRTAIVDALGEVGIEDMIADEDMVITMSHEGYVKRSAATTYSAQGRGGRGIKGMASKDNDFVETMFVASAHANILFFTNFGRCYSLKVYNIPEAGRQSKGRPIVNLIQFQDGEKIASMLPVKEFTEGLFVAQITENGTINKQPLPAYAAVRRNGLNSMKLDESDKLITAVLCEDEANIVIATATGRAIRFKAKDARSLGRNTRGVRAVKLREDTVVGMVAVMGDENILTITENGYGKRTNIEEYRTTKRGGVGIINIKGSERNGAVVNIMTPSEDEDIMIITQKGIIIRTAVELIKVIGRNTQGVRLIKLGKGDTVIDVTSCEKEEPEAEEQLDENGEVIVTETPSEETVAVIEGETPTTTDIEGEASAPEATEDSGSEE
jgi:DNA gyrase subunit A